MNMPQASFTSDDIRAELLKTDWFGVDPHKSRRAMELGAYMVPFRFNTAAEYAAALIAAMEVH